METKHRKSLTPGYHCAVSCPHEPKGDHGIEREKWHFTTLRTDFALELAVLTPFFPPTVLPWRTGDYKFAFELYVHGAHPTSKYVVEYNTPCPCDYVPGPGCYVYEYRHTPCLERVCRDFQQEAKLEQPQAFWDGLDEVVVDVITDYEGRRKADGDLRWRKCSCCKGEGIIDLNGE